MKTKNYQVIAGRIQRIVATNRNRICLKVWRDELKTFLNAAEATRLFDYYKNVEKLFEPVTNFHFACDARQDHFTADAVRDIFLNFNIQSRFGRIKGVSPYKKEIPEVEYISANERNKEFQTEEVLTLVSSINPLNKFSTEELINELLSRNNISDVTVKYINVI